MMLDGLSDQKRKIHPHKFTMWVAIGRDKEFRGRKKQRVLGGEKKGVVGNSSRVNQVKAGLSKGNS